MRPLLVLALLLGGASCASRSGSSDADVQELLGLHAAVIRAHLESDVALFPEQDGGSFVMANRGEITHPDPQEMREGMADYLGRTRFSVYRDQVPPIVRVSQDGTLGWVIVQVEAEGEQTSPEGQVEPLSFVCAWIELYEKRAGRWRSVGNLSSFKP